jgi:hypothetical protein
MCALSFEVFTLTPTLSLRERELIVSGHEGARGQSPLPSGEGQGEGLLLFERRDREQRL